MPEGEQKSSSKKWVDVVTHPLGLVGFALFLVFGLLSQPELAGRHPWLVPAAVSMAALALLAACTIALLPVIRGKKLTTDERPSVHPTPQATPQTVVRQKTQGAPAIGTVGGSVHIGDVHQHALPADPKAHQRFLELLDRKDLDIAERDRQLEELSEKYQELQTRLESGPETTERSHKVAELIRQGEFEKGGVLLDEALEGAESDVEQAAEYHYQRGRLWEIQFEPLRSLPHFESAYRYRPTSPEYAHAFAQLLQKQRRYAESDKVYSQNLRLLREGAKGNPAAYLPDVATTLNNLALLYGDTQRMEPAEKAYDEALEIRRGLAKDNPAAYLPAVGETLLNRARFLFGADRLAEGDSSLSEATSLLQECSSRSPAVFGDSLARCLLLKPVLFPALVDDSASVCDLAREAREVANDPRLQDVARRLIEEHCEPESATTGD